MQQGRQVHRPQALAGKVTGVESMEVVKLVVVVCLSLNTPMIMRKSQLQRNERARVLVTCILMESGHRDAYLTLMLSHPTPLAIRTDCHPNVCPLVMIARNTHPILISALDPHYPPICLPHCSLNLPMRVAVYLYPHLANRTHLQLMPSPPRNLHSLTPTSKLHWLLPRHDIAVSISIG